jgi:hypothetical protein|nr:MAG TPA: hypothetical protein [Crassvirales sp.]
MGKIKKITENELVGGTQSTDVYPVTSVKAVYDESNERLDNILNRRGVVNISTNYNADHIAEVLTLEQAIAKVPSKDRVLGFQGKFQTSEGWKSYIFTGDSVSNWSDISKWIELISSKKFTELESKLSKNGVILNETISLENGKLLFINEEIPNGSDLYFTLSDKIDYIAITEYSGEIEGETTYYYSENTIKFLYSTKSNVTRLKLYFGLRSSIPNFNIKVFKGYIPYQVEQNTVNIENLLNDKTDTYNTLKEIGLELASNKTLPPNFGLFIDAIKSIRFIPKDSYKNDEIVLYVCSAYDDGTEQTKYRIWAYNITSKVDAAKYESEIINIDTSTIQTIQAYGECGELQAEVDFNTILQAGRALVWTNYSFKIQKISDKSALTTYCNAQGKGYAYIDNVVDIIKSKNGIYKRTDSVSDSLLIRYSEVIVSAGINPKRFAKDHDFIINVLTPNHSGDNTFSLWVQDYTANVPIGSFGLTQDDLAKIEQKDRILIKNITDYGTWFCVINYNKLLEIGELTWGGNDICLQRINQEDPNTINLLSPANKSIWWCGTSIPEGGYPKIVGDLLYCNIYNVAKGSSMARRGSTNTEDGYGWTGVPYDAVMYSLTQTLSEKEELINNWDKWKLLLANSTVSDVPNVLTDEMKELIRNCSYEKKLIPYLDGTYTQPDIFVIDHGFNDWINPLGGDFVADQLPEDVFDRNTYIGAINFLIKTIYKYVPRAKIVIIGHYENTSNERAKKITQAQEFIANYWGIPIIKLWELTGISPARIETYGYWKDGYWKIGEELREVSMTEVWMPDSTHPGADKTGECNNRIANLLAKHLSLIL